MKQFTVRMADINDAEAILNIYEPFIINTVVTFEYDRIPVPVFQERMRKIMSQFPWLVCCIDNSPIGYAYCSMHRERAAFAWDCDCTVYLSEPYQHKGIAAALYEALFQIVKVQGYYTVYSLICTDNSSSIEFHRKHEFKEICTFYNTAYKLGQWRHLMVMEKSLRIPDGEPKSVLSLNQVDPLILDEVIHNAELSINSYHQVNQ